MKEIRNYTQFNRIYHIYTSICDIGRQMQTMEGQNKAANSILQHVKNMATDTIPAGEELASSLSPLDTMTLKDWLEFQDAPDLLLEKELVWPVEPELIY